MSEGTDPLISYTPFGDDAWTEQPCLYGDLLLEAGWAMAPGLYVNTEIGEGPESWSI